MVTTYIANTAILAVIAKDVTIHELRQADPSSPFDSIEGIRLFPGGRVVRHDWRASPRMFVRRDRGRGNAVE